jgi:uncharacterized membrane protein YphA (DoxX/SURF4 family)
MPATTPPAAFVGTGGRLRSECMVAFNRNPWPQSPESAAGDVNNMIHFYKNLVMAGGFLYVMTYGAGAMSIDGVDEA